MQVITLEDLLGALRLRGQMLPARHASAIARAVSRLAAAQAVALRPRAVFLDSEDGFVLDLAEAERRPLPGAYRPRGSGDPLLHTTGALLCELLTGDASAVERAHGPLGEVVRAALRPSHGARFFGISELCDAIESAAPMDMEAEIRVAHDLIEVYARWEAGDEEARLDAGEAQEALPRSESIDNSGDTKPPRATAMPAAVALAGPAIRVVLPGPVQATSTAPVRLPGPHKAAPDKRASLFTSPANTETAAVTARAPLTALSPAKAETAAVTPRAPPTPTRPAKTEPVAATARIPSTSTRRTKPETAVATARAPSTPASAARSALVAPPPVSPAQVEPSVPIPAVPGTPAPGAVSQKALADLRGEIVRLHEASAANQQRAIAEALAAEKLRSELDETKRGLAKLEAAQQEARVALASAESARRTAMEKAAVTETRLAETAAELQNRPAWRAVLLVAAASVAVALGASMGLRLFHGTAPAPDEAASARPVTQTASAQSAPVQAAPPPTNQATPGPADQRTSATDVQRAPLPENAATPSTAPEPAGVTPAATAAAAQVEAPAPVQVPVPMPAVPAEAGEVQAAQTSSSDSQPGPPRQLRRRSPAVGRAKSAARVQVDRGDRALRKGNTDEALAAFQAALSEHSDLPEAVRGIAMVHLSQGHERQAKHEYMRYLQLSPGAPDAARIRKVVANLGDAE
jgi:tetratricopeptide (TPR) repeat protein